MTLENDTFISPVLPLLKTFVHTFSEVTFRVSFTSHTSHHVNTHHFWLKMILPNLNTPLIHQIWLWRTSDISKYLPSKDKDFYHWDFFFFKGLQALRYMVFFLQTIKISGVGKGFSFFQSIIYFIRPFTCNSTRFLQLLLCYRSLWHSGEAYGFPTIMFKWNTHFHTFI